MVVNGVIFQEMTDNGYKGIEGNNWYLNEIYPSTIGRYFEENIEMAALCTPNWVDVCTDESFIMEYIRLSQANGIDFRILLVETNQNNPQMNLTFGYTTFLGYDYAYPGGDYYSSVYEDIYLRRLKYFSNIKLNEYGLFEKKADVEDFVVKRNQLEHTVDNDLEKGNFIVYKLSQINI